MFDADHPGSVIPDDIMKAVEHRAVEILREDAGHRFESDGFDMETCETAVEAIRNDGFDPDFWYTSPDVVEDAREWYAERARLETPDTGLDAAPMIAHVSPIQAPEGVVDDALYLVGEGAVVEPPIPAPSTPILVREPKGVAVVDL